MDESYALEFNYIRINENVHKEPRELNRCEHDVIENENKKRFNQEELRQNSDNMERIIP